LTLNVTWPANSNIKEAKMELYELGKQYLIASETLTLRIHQLNAEVKKLKGNDLIIMKRRLLSLYIDAAECRRCAQRLMNYNYNGYRKSK
jgi:hypothetical protein